MYTRDFTNVVVYHTNFDLFGAPAANLRDTFYCHMAPKPPNPEELPPPCSRRWNPSDAVRDRLLLFFPFSVSVIDWNVVDDLITVGEDPEEDSKADSVEKKEESDSTFENSTIAVTSTAEIMEEPPNNKTHIDRYSKYTECGFKFPIPCNWLQGEVWGWTCFFIGVAAVGIGPSYYHVKPNDATLVWDCLPMTIAFTSIMAIFIIERIDEQKGTVSILPLLLAGVISMLYWRFFDDLHPYALVQFVPCIVIPIMAILLPPMYTHSTFWLWAAGFYLLAKVEEAADKPIYKCTHHIVSGHTLKHLCAAMVPVFLTLMLAKRTTETESFRLYYKTVPIRNSNLEARIWLEFGEEEEEEEEEKKEKEKKKWTGRGNKIGWMRMRMRRRAEAEAEAGLQCDDRPTSDELRR
ncbi:hypothetical protein CsSME_00047447 [Camellia sinensis var. sinensis]